MDEPRTLTWPKGPGSEELAPHVFRVASTGSASCQLFMVIKKKNGVQSLPAVDVPVSLSDFCAAFNGKKWEEVTDATVQGEDFFAIRYVRLPHERGFVVWRVHHKNDTPDDVLAYFAGRLPELRALFANH